MTLNMNLAISVPTSPALTAEKTSTSKVTGPARSSIVRIVRGNSGVERSDSYRWVRWAHDEVSILRNNASRKPQELQALLPRRTIVAIKSKRVNLGLLKWTYWSLDE